MGRSASWWVGRGAWAVVTAAGLFASTGACGDDDPASGADAGTDGFVQPLPPYDGGTPPAEGVDTTGRLGTPVVVADIGQAVDGPSWRVADQALYFTVPGTAPTLRRLVAGGAVEPVAIYDGGPPGPYGTASGGGATLFATEPNAIAMLDLDADGGPAITRRNGTFELLGDIAVETRPDASALAFFVDTARPRAYRFDPAAGANDLTRVLDLDAGARATGIAVGRNDLSHQIVYVAVGTGATGTVFVLDQDAIDAGEENPEVPSLFALPGTSPNGIAVDDQNFIVVAWARGIDVYRDTGERLGSSPGLPLSAAPTNIAFGGPDRKTLYITTAAGKIYAVPVQVPGVLR